MSADEQQALCRLVRESCAIRRVFNRPPGAPRRFTHLRALHEAGFNQYQVWLGAQVLTARAFPLVLRHIVTGDALSPAIASLEGLRQACGRLQCDIEEVFGVELCAQQGRDGLYRKYSCFVVGTRSIPAHLHLGKHWLIRGRNRVATTEALAEESDFLAQNPHHEQLCEAARICGVDFARIDYGLLEGRVQVYEFNMTPGLGVPVGQAYRENSVRMALREAFALL
jgi:hypothetical protein